ncbi:hypothetical protein OsI_21731 [Oryza sativa Indica Group]|uniref:Uncharacterized protein n=1 Tax=Oryza sativa subsp. indica TaxID=39946 RepID=B8B302_ORYSI|nr:hypothetical protein OsI_21731 [Oryza sativa Indica Group]
MARMRTATTARWRSRMEPDGTGYVGHVEADQGPLNSKVKMIAVSLLYVYILLWYYAVVETLIQLAVHKRGKIRSANTYPVKI